MLLPGSEEAFQGTLRTEGHSGRLHSHTTTGNQEQTPIHRPVQAGMERRLLGSVRTLGR